MYVAGKTNKHLNKHMSCITSITKYGLAFFMLAAGITAAIARPAPETQNTSSNGWLYASDIVTDADIHAAFARLLFPGGKPKALIISCDDGRVHDRRFVEILNNYGIRGTFNLNRSSLDKEGYIAREEILKLYAGHEVACHTASHSSLTKLTDDEIRVEIMSNRADLEKILGLPVRGLAYPSGDQDPRVAASMPPLGLAYGRCVGSTHWFGLPKNPFLWVPTCQLGNRWMDDATTFLSRTNGPSVMLAWGHSYDFGQDDKWNLLEDFCRIIGRKTNIWYTTCIEVIDYIEASKRLQVSASGGFLKNPSAIPVWIAVNGQTIEIKAGETVDTAKPGMKTGEINSTKIPRPLRRVGRFAGLPAMAH